MNAAFAEDRAEAAEAERVKLSEANLELLHAKKAAEKALAEARLELTERPRLVLERDEARAERDGLRDAGSACSFQTCEHVSGLTGEKWYLRIERDHREKAVESTRRAEAQLAERFTREEAKELAREAYRADGFLPPLDASLDAILERIRKGRKP
jgi:hypothetical protein